MKLSLWLAGILFLSSAPPDVRYERLLELKPGEGVFAYARISPSGRHLAYASEMPRPGGRGITQTETVVDLESRKVVFAAPGIDGYFSNDGQRMIFLSFADPAKDQVAIYHVPTGRVANDVAPRGLGDYFSWGVRDGRDLILTILGRYYYLDGDRRVLTADQVVDCPGIGRGDRPLLSKDGRRITTFVKGNIVVRGLDNCNGVLDTGLQGAKADFSFDGRYVAFHVEKAERKGYEIVIVDTEARTVRTLTGLAGSSLFPSWTRDGRLCFRYDGEDYRGFMMASDVLSLPTRPLAATERRMPEAMAWSEVFADPAPAHRTNLVMIWSDWSPHAPDALLSLQALSQDVRRQGLDVGVMTAVPPSSRRDDIDRILRSRDIVLPEVPLRADRLHLTGALNQIPTQLLFQDGRLVGRHLGPQSTGELSEWLARSIDALQK